MGIEVYWIVVVAGFVFCAGFYWEAVSVQKKTLLKVEGFTRERIPQVIVERLVKYDPTEIVRQVSLRAEITPPAFLAVRDSSLLAHVFYVGVEKTIVCGRSLLVGVSEQEFEGVIAHEIGHIKESPVFRCVWYSLGGLMSLSLLFLVAAPAAPLFGIFIQGFFLQETSLIFTLLALFFMLLACVGFYCCLAYRPQMEFDADRKALSFTRYPRDFVNLLSRLARLDELPLGIVLDTGNSVRHPPMRDRAVAAKKILEEQEAKK